MPSSPTPRTLPFALAATLMLAFAAAHTTPSPTAPSNGTAARAAVALAAAPAYLPLALANIAVHRLPRPSPFAPTPTVAVGPTIAPPRPTSGPSPTSALPPAPSRTPDTKSKSPSLVYVPALDGSAGGGSAGCQPAVVVQNVGAEPSKVVLVAWGASTGPSACATAAGPSKVLCSGTIKPGANWTFDAAVLPAGLQSAYAVAFNQRMLDAAGIEVSVDDVFGDYLCEVLFFDVTADASEEARFRRAYLEGAVFLGVPLDQAYGGPIAVQVTRTCPAGDAAAVPRPVDVAAYAGPAHADIAFATRRDGSPAAVGGEGSAGDAYRYALPALVADGHRTALVHVQNADFVCNEVDVLVLEAGGTASTCAHLSLPPGEGRTIDIAACRPGDASNRDRAPLSTAGWAVGTGPLAVAVDIVGEDAGWPVVASYAAPNPGQPPEGRAGVGPRLAAPLALEPDIVDGADAEVFVQNVDADRPAVVDLAFVDRAGDPSPYGPRSAVLPPGGHTSFVVLALGESLVASLYVTSRPDPAAPDFTPPTLAAVVVQGRGRHGPLGLAEPVAALAADALAPMLDPRSGAPADAVRGTRLALPSVGIDEAAPGADKRSGRATTVALFNRIAKPGFTDAVLYFYDANGLLDYLCQKLNERQIEYIDLRTWGYISPGFHGSAIVSAWFWEHDVFDAQGAFVANLVDLDAAYGDVMPGSTPGRTWTHAVPFTRDFPAGGVVEPLCASFPDMRVGTPQP